MHIYKAADLEVVALQGLDLEVDPGEMVAIAGRSGSGKTTLMNILAGLERPSAGVVRVAGHDLSRLDRAEQDRYRRDVVGYVLQHAAGNVAPYLSALENVEAATLSGTLRSRAQRAGELLDRLGLAERMSHRPTHLTGQENQRLALATALAVGKALTHPVTLTDIKQNALFADSPLLRQGRLSVVPLTEK